MCAFESLGPACLNDRTKPETVSAWKVLSLRPDSLGWAGSLVFKKVEVTMPSSYDLIHHCAKLADVGVN